jgi:putative heme transporter
VTAASANVSNSRVRRLLSGRLGGGALTVAVIAAIFAGVIPQLADYSQAWGLVQALSWSEALGLSVVAVVNLLTYAPVWMSAVPGLGLRRALLADQASTAISNTVPVGFAFGVGTTAAMFHSFGFSAAVITRAVTLTGVWNNLVKLAMPALALAGLGIAGHTTAGLRIAAVLGSVVLFLAVGLLVSALVDRTLAATLASAAERLAGAVARARSRPGPSGWVRRANRFRLDSLELLRHRWLQLSASAVVSHVALFLVLLVSLRAVGGTGSDIHWIVVLSVFSLTRLVTIVPITPGALGVAELSYLAGLTAVGVEPGAATATVLLFRFLTWFLPIPFGATAWFLWRRGAGQRRRGAELPAVAPS